MTDNKKVSTVYSFVYVDGKLVGAVSVPQITEKPDITDNIARYEVKQIFYPTGTEIRVHGS